jgi:hypothetical protein
MKQFVLFCAYLSFLITANAFAQYNYDVSATHPFGQPNPEAPAQIKDYQFMIGECDCISTRRNQDGEWGAPENMIWRYKYIMNGMAVQDETLKEDGAHTGSIRQFIADSAKWYVHFYSNNSPSTRLPTWEGTKKGDTMVLYKEQAAPNGADGFYRITFYDMSKTGYKWEGAWTSVDESIVFPTWKIVCTRPKK